MLRPSEDSVLRSHRERVIVFEDSYGNQEGEGPLAGILGRLQRSLAIVV
jgi:hypothetical protein